MEVRREEAAERERCEGRKRWRYGRRSGEREEGGREEVL